MANEWNVSYPIDHTTIGDVPGEIRKLKTSTKTQIDREHEIPVDGDATGGEHSLGSSVLYMGTSAPTNRPDGSTALASNNIDKGRLWLDTNYTPPALKYWSGSAWVTMGILVVGASPSQCFLISTTAEDSDGGREVQIRAKGTQSGAEVTTLGYIEFSHDGASDDQKGKVAIVLNDGDDSDAPSKKAIEFISTGKVGVANSLAVLDEDNMISDDAEVLATQQSIKKYIDDQIVANAANSNSLAKGWALVASNGTLGTNYNVSGVVRNSAGKYTISWDTDFASANYVVFVTTSVESQLSPLYSSQLAGSIDIWFNTNGAGYTDAAFHVIAFGAQ